MGTALRPPPSSVEVVMSLAAQPRPRRPPGAFIKKYGAPAGSEAGGAPRPPPRDARSARCGGAGRRLEVGDQECRAATGPGEAVCEEEPMSGSAQRALGGVRRLATRGGTITGNEIRKC